MACNKRGPRHHIRILITKLIRLLSKTETLPWRCAPAEYLNLHKGEWHAQLEQYHSSGAATAPAQVLVGELAIIQYKCLHVCLLKK